MEAKAINRKRKQEERVMRSDGGKFGAWFLGIGLLAGIVLPTFFSSPKRDVPKEPQAVEMKLAAEEIAKPPAVKARVVEQVTRKAAVPIKATPAATKVCEEPSKAPDIQEEAPSGSFFSSFFGDIFSSSREEETAMRADPTEDSVKISLRVNKEQREKEWKSIRGLSNADAMKLLKQPIDPLITKDGRSLFEDEDKALQSTARRMMAKTWAAVCHAKKTGLWEVVLRVCEGLNVSSDVGMALNIFESGGGRDGRNEHSGADGAYQYIGKYFLEDFTRHAKTFAPIVDEVNPALHKQMMSYVGLTKIASKGNTCDVKFDIDKCREYLGRKNVAKWSDAQVEKDIRERIQRLCNPAGKDQARGAVLSAALAMNNLFVKVPEDSRGLACLPRLVHNYGQRGGTIIADAYKKSPNRTMFDVMMEINKKSFKSGADCAAYAEKVLWQNGMRTAKGKADKGLTVGAFVGKMDREWKIVANIVSQIREKMELADGLNQFLSESDAPVRVVWDPSEKILFSLEHVSDRAPARTALRAKGAGPAVKVSVLANR